MINNQMIIIQPISSQKSNKYEIWLIMRDCGWYFSRDHSIICYISFYFLFHIYFWMIISVWEIKLVHSQLQMKLSSFQVSLTSFSLLDKNDDNILISLILFIFSLLSTYSHFSSLSFSLFLTYFLFNFCVKKRLTKNTIWKNNETNFTKNSSWRRRSTWFYHFIELKIGLIDSSFFSKILTNNYF